MFYFIKILLPINLFRISESEIPRRILIENSAEYELDPLEYNSFLRELQSPFRK
jgi:hypothetical protein